MPPSASISTRDLLQRIKTSLAQDLHAYPYPIAGCDEVFKTLVHQKECCRIALAGLAGHDGLTRDDAAIAIGELLATPVALTDPERRALAELTRTEEAAA